MPRGDPYTLQHPDYELKFQGRLRQADCSWFFLEDITSFKVEAPVSVAAVGRDAITSRDRTLYLAMRGEHAKAKQKKSQAARKELRKSQIPKEVGDLTLDGVTRGGKLAYRWQDVRVEATPTRL